MAMPRPISFVSSTPSTSENFYAPDGPHGGSPGQKLNVLTKPRLNGRGFCLEQAGIPKYGLRWLLFAVRWMSRVAHFFLGNSMPYRAQHLPRATVICGATILHGDLLVRDTTVTLADGVIQAVGGAVGNAHEIGANGLTLLPGIVDIHGDAFERALCPRSGVNLPVAMALQENDHWLVASGVTTFFCSLTDSFEAGLRGRATVRAIISALADAVSGHFACNTRIHIRHERCLTSGHDELLAWMAAGRVHLLSTADHLPTGDDPVKLARYRDGVRRRLPLRDADIDAVIAHAQSERPRGLQQEIELAARARVAGIPLASHDDDTPKAVDMAQARGVSISEFPTTIETATQAQAAGMVVLMGAPNYIRGGSHVGCINVKDALAANVVDALCSDYHYPSLLQAPFQLAASGTRTFAQAWAMVSATPARAVGLGQRKGLIARGYDADLILVDQRQPLARLRTVLVGGRIVADWPG